MNFSLISLHFGKMTTYEMLNNRIDSKLRPSKPAYETLVLIAYAQMTLMGAYAVLSYESNVGLSLHLHPCAVCATSKDPGGTVGCASLSESWLLAYAIRAKVSCVSQLYFS